MTTNEVPLHASNQPAKSASIGQTPQTAREYLTSYVSRIRAGDIGPLPIIIGLLIIATIFQSLNSNFLTPRNIVNLILQMAGITTIAYGVVFVLLLGEIDLSVGYVSAVAGVLTTILMRPPHDLPWFVAVGIAILAVLVIGFVHGSLITFFQLPSFIVTLAGLLGWNGVVLLLVGAGGTISVREGPVRDLANTYLPSELSWILAALLVVGFASTKILQWRNRKALGLSITPLPIIAGQVVGLAVLMFGVVMICIADRGVPVIGVGIVLMLLILTFVTKNTRFGRYVFAVGGNKEAARRASIRVERIRLYVFMISSLMAGIGGIILASRLKSVATNSGGGQLLLNSIAAAVIGGTSLFGGRGSMTSAVLGALVIASVENGMGFLGIDASVQFIITGLVLLVAVIVDSVSRSSQKRSGLA
jgi:D-xylose transport system permease protein